MSPALVVGLLAAGIAGGAAGWGRLRPVEVPRAGVWLARPVVWADPEIEGRELARAVGWWAAHGEILDHTADRRIATVILRIDPLLERRTVARTRVWQADGVIVDADVRLRPGADALTIAHELGHALGYQHPRAAPSGHLLHPWSPGWDARGLESR